VFAIEFLPPFLFRRFWIALQIPCAIAEMIDGRQTIEPFELQRLIHGQSDEGVWLTEIFLVPPRKTLRSLLMRNIPCRQPPLRMLARPCSGFAIKESSATERFRQGAAQPIFKLANATHDPLPAIKAFVIKKSIERMVTMK
jgi:hypothetical protein